MNYSTIFRIQIISFLSFFIFSSNARENTIGSENSAIFDKKYRQQLKELVSKYKWAQKEKKLIVHLADRIAKQSDSELWLSVLPQSIPRALYVNRKWGCPKCGKEIFKKGYYPWIKLHGKFKLQCPICKDKFPTNDFYKYYLSGLDKSGTFDREKADKSLLFNVKHPNPKDPLHKYGVDDGIGYIVNKNKHYRFIAHYNLFSNWYSGGANFKYKIYNILDKAMALGYAYAFTENPLYAEKAGILLDRYADLYPDYDMNYWTRRGRNFWASSNTQGKAADDIWSSILSAKAPLVYGLIYDGLKKNPKFYSFLSKQAKRYKLSNKKGNFKDFTDNVENNLFANELISFKERIIVGNTGFASRAIVLMALVTRSKKIRHDLIDFLISPSLEHKSKKNAFSYKHIMGLDLFGEMSLLSRNGFSWEGGFGYISILPKAFTQNYPALKTLSAQIEDPEFKSRFKLGMKFLKYRLIQFYYNACQTVCLGKYTPNFGDGGKFGVGFIPYGATPQDLGTAFSCLQDDLLGKLYLASTKNSKNKQSLGTQLLNPFFNYERFNSQLEKIKAKKDKYEYSASSENMTGRGFVYLRSGGPKHRRGLALYYGDTGGHNHNESCSINLYGYGADLTPGLGYPNLSRRNMRLNWNDNVLSHNTVCVDLKRQYPDLIKRAGHAKEKYYISDQKIFAESSLASIVDIDARKAYPQLKKYNRSCALVNIDKKDFYVVDFFAVQGGSDHISSFHGNAGTTSHDEIKLTKQEKGTYAGASIPFDSKQGGGLQFLYDVRKGTLKDRASVEWQIKDFRKQLKYGDTIRLRATALSYKNQEFVLAEGKPPQNIPSNPKSTTYMLRRRRGKNLSTLFITVYESYLEGKRRIKEIKLIPKKQGGAFCAALEIIFTDGTKDIVVKGAGENNSAIFEKNISLKGNMSIARYSKSNKLEEIMIAKSSKLTLPGYSWTGKSSFKAKIIDYSRNVNYPATITLDKYFTAQKDLIYPLWTDADSPLQRIDANYKILSIKNNILKVDASSFLAYKNYHNPSFKGKKIQWKSIIKKIAKRNSKTSRLLPLLPKRIAAKIRRRKTIDAETMSKAFSKLLTSQALAKDAVLTNLVKNHYAKKAREQGIKNLIKKDLMLYNYMTMAALFPKDIPAYPAFIYELKKGRQCTIPLNYYISKKKR